jgi:hypothetical protein
MILGAQIWDYWLAWAIAIGAVVTVLALVAGYLMKVVSPQYPKRNQR